MTRLALLLAVVLATGCATKPSSEDCRKAIENMQRLLGTDNMRDDGRIEGEVRRCKGGSTKKAVACAMKAQTLDDLRHCKFFKLPDTLPAGGSAAGSATGSAAGSATGSATGSAATGSDTTGSAATGTGSASGSAATGSAATPGAAAGSAATTPPAGAGSAK